MSRRMTFRGLVGASTVSITLLAPLAMWCGGFEAPWKPRPDPPPLPPLASLKDMAELVTTDLHLSTTIEGGNNHFETKYQIHGEAHLGVDLSRAAYAEIDPVHRKAVLRLPKPHLIMSKVDHDRSEELWMRSKVIFATSDAQLVRAEVWKAADRKIERMGQAPDYMECTKKQAQTVLDQLFEGLAWSVRFEWDGEQAKGLDDPDSSGQPNSLLASRPEGHTKGDTKNVSEATPPPSPAPPPL